MDSSLTISSFQRGRQCLKRLYFSRQGLSTPSTSDFVRQSLSDQGNEVKEIARALFAGGINLAANPGVEREELVQNTAAAIDAGHTILFNACFLVDGIYLFADIVVIAGDFWKLYEVKSTSAIKETMLWDIAFKTKVLKWAGALSVKSYAVHINTGYRLKGSIVPEQLLKVKEVSKIVRKLLPEVEALITAEKAMLDEGVEPVVKIGPHCRKPHACEFMSICWKDLPEQSVLELTHSNGKEWELYREGIQKMTEIPGDYVLSVPQSQQVNAWKKGAEVIEHKALKQFLARLRFPVFHLDFESFATAVPVYQNTKPFQQIPFQYSIHLQEAPGAEAIHRSYLAPALGDPRQELLKKLLRDTEGNGSILAYNDSFERKVFHELALLFPSQSAEIEQRLSRLVDLIEPFQKHWYYTAPMNGSSSIKNVLPAIAPEFDYKAQAVSDGAEASHAFLQLMRQNYPGDPEALRKSLEEYSTLDTLGMVFILNKLFEKAG